MFLLAKYATGTGADVLIPITKRGAVDFAVGADWTPSAGDVKVSLDGGAAASITTLPTALTMGNTALWVFTFSNAELTCKKLVVTVSDSATKVVEDQAFIVYTYGHASAFFPADLGAAAASTGALLQYGTGAGQIATDAGGNVKIASNIRKNTALSGFQVPMRLSSDHVTLATGKTVTCSISKNGAAFGASTNSPAEIGTTGIYTVDLAAADLNANSVFLYFAATGCDPSVVLINTFP